MEHFSSTHQSAPIANVKKIAVLRANALGDFIFVLPALEALRATYPEAEIVLLAKKWHQSFLKGRPSPIDRVIIVPPYRGVGETSDIVEDDTEIALFFERMANEHFDLAMQMHGGGGYSNRFLLRLQPCLTVGLKTLDAPPLDQNLPYIYEQHEVMRYLELVRLVGAQIIQVEPQLSLLPQDLEESEAVVPLNQLPLVVLHPGASEERRRWPANYFAEVGDALAQVGARIVVTGSAKEQELVSQTITKMQAPALNISGQLSIGGLAGLLSRCHVVIANDTGPLHLAHAVGTPTVGLFWCRNVITATPFTRQYHRPIISWRLTCPICGAHCIYNECDHQTSWISDIPSEEVISQALQLLAPMINY